MPHSAISPRCANGGREHRVLGHEAQVAAEHERHAHAGDGAVDGGDHGFGTDRR